MKKWGQKPRIWMDNLRFRYKMIALTTVCVLLVGIVSILGHHFSIARYTRALYEQTTFAMSLFNRQIRFEMERMENLSNTLALDSVIQENLFLLSQEDITEVERYQARYKIIQTLYSHLEPEVLCITLIPRDGSDIRCGLDSSPEADNVMEMGLQTSDGKNGAGFWLDNSRGDGSVLIFREIRKRNDPYFLTHLGYLVVRVNYGMLIRQTWTGIDVLQNQRLLITNPESNVFFSNFEDGIEVCALRPSDGQAYAVRTVDGRRHLITCSTLTSTDPNLEVLSGIPYDDLFYTIAGTQAITLAAMVAAVLLAILLASFAVKSINQKIELLTDKIDMFKSGNMKPADRDADYGKDEFGMLNKHFDSLTIELNRTIEDNYVKQLLITQAQLRNLEQQIHPHFLYNTLETVNWFAKLQGDKNIPVIIDALSDLLRSNLAVNEDVVTLGKELAALGSYVTIQKIRYSDMLQVSITIAPEVQATPIPKLTLQPLVENAIFHSMEENLDGCRIWVSARADNNRVIVSVKNNGSQIDEDILEKLRNKTVVTRGHGIGLLNIDSRVRMIFGEGYGLRFINEEDSVTVEVHLPKDMLGESEEAGDDQDADS